MTPSSEVEVRGVEVIEVVGGPCDGQWVRELVTVDGGTWVMERAWLCRPVDARGYPREYWPYRLRDGRYVWTGGEVVRSNVSDEDEEDCGGRRGATA